MHQDNNLLDFLQSNYNEFTPSQKRIALYVAQNFKECTFHTIDELAKRCEVNPSTLLRFCRDIGFNGYPQFQKALQQNLLDRLNHAEHSDYLSRPMMALLNQNQDSNPSVNSLQNDIKILNDLAANLNPEEIKEFSKRLFSAKKRYFICTKGSYGIGHLFYYRLHNILRETVLLQDWDGGLYDNLIDIDPDDVLIAINGPRYSSRTVKFAKYVYEKNLCPIISITDCQASPLYLISKICLFYPCSSISFIRSFVGMLSLINCILVEIAANDMEGNLKRLEQYEEIFDYFGIIHKDVK